MTNTLNEIEETKLNLGLDNLEVKELKNTRKFELLSEGLSKEQVNAEFGDFSSDPEMEDGIAEHWEETVEDTKAEFGDDYFSKGLEFVIDKSNEEFPSFAGDLRKTASKVASGIDYFTEGYFSSPFDGEEFWNENFFIKGFGSRHMGLKLKEWLQPDHPILKFLDQKIVLMDDEFKVNPIEAMDDVDTVERLAYGFGQLFADLPVFLASMVGLRKGKVPVIPALGGSAFITEKIAHQQLKDTVRINTNGGHISPTQWFMQFLTEGNRQAMQNALALMGGGVAAKFINPRFNLKSIFAKSIPWNRSIQLTH